MKGNTSGLDVTNFFRGSVLADDYPPRRLPTTPKFGLRLLQSRPGTKSGDVFLMGPKYVQRTLKVSESLIKGWCEANAEILESARPRPTTRQFPYFMVVLREWVTDTWVHISWTDRNSTDGDTTIALFQESDELPPQWGYLQLPDKPLLITKMNSDLAV